MLRANYINNKKMSIGNWSICTKDNILDFKFFQEIAVSVENKYTYNNFIVILVDGIIKLQNISTSQIFNVDFLFHSFLNGFLDTNISLNILHNINIINDTLEIITFNFTTTST